jgi:hypothetical protein
MQAAIWAGLPRNVAGTKSVLAIYAASSAAGWTSATQPVAGLV